MHNIKDIDPLTWFQKYMSGIRQTFLDGGMPAGCEPCQKMEQHGKVSGRQKQLLKTGVIVQNFVKTMQSSPWISEWQQCQSRQGLTDVTVQDWQIDLGNFCNSACLFCNPNYSSRLAAEFKKLSLITETPKNSWCDDPALLERFLQTLKASPEIKYMHFIGGETLITPAFRKILHELIKAGLNRRATIGFTTNLTVIDDEIENLLIQFENVHVGVSIECIDQVNDYVRYGSKIDTAKQIMERWLDLARQQNWLLQIRTTPTVLTVSRLADIYEYAWNNKVTVESCNFIYKPAFMKPSVLPLSLRHQARDRLALWIRDKDQNPNTEQIINVRHPDFVQQQLLQDASSYIQYLHDEPDNSHLLPDLVRYLKIMDTNRNNSVLDYLPEYEELFRSAGY